MSELRERLVRRSERFDLPRDALGRMFERGARLQRRRRLAAPHGSSEHSPTPPIVATSSPVSTIATPLIAGSRL